jgi:hypothetical protein
MNLWVMRKSKKWNFLSFMCEDMERRGEESKSRGLKIRPSNKNNARNHRGGAGINTFLLDEGRRFMLLLWWLSNFTTVLCVWWRACILTNPVSSLPYLSVLCFLYPTPTSSYCLRGFVRNERIPESVCMYVCVYVCMVV